MGRMFASTSRELKETLPLSWKIIFSIIPWTDSSRWSWSSLIVDQHMYEDSMMLLTLVMYISRDGLVGRPRSCMESFLGAKNANSYRVKPGCLLFSPAGLAGNIPTVWPSSIQ